MSAHSETSGPPENPVPDPDRGPPRRLGPLLALTTALVAILLRRRTSSLTRRAGRRAARQEEFHRFARALAAARTSDEVLEILLHRTVEAIGATAGYVEMAEHDRREVEIRAATGRGAPPVGLRAAYPGSLTRAATAAGEPTVSRDPGAVGAEMRTELEARCPGCAVIVAPLLEDDHAIAALVLLRAPGGGPFRGRDTRWVRAAADFAALALRRAILFEAAERRRRTAEIDRQRFRSLFTYSPNAVFELDSQGGVVSANPAAERITGYPPDEARRRGWTTLVVPEDIDEANRAVEAVATGSRYEGEIAIARRDGRRVELRLTGLPIVVDGEVVGIFGIGEDITERKRAESARQRLIAILEEAADFIAMADAQGRTLYINRAGREMLGIPLDEDVTGVPISRIAPQPGFDKLVREALPAAARTGRWRGEMMLVNGSGRTIHVSVFVIGHRDAEGRVEFYSTIIRDITATKESERRITELLEREKAVRTEAEERREQVERLMEKKARLIRGFSHDLKNPLGAIDGYAQILEAGLKGELNPEQAEGIARIRHAVRSMLELIENLVDLARAEVGDLKLDCRWIEPTPAIHAAVDEHRAGAEHGDLDLVTEVPDTLPGLYTDPDRLRQILENLLSNAIKYTGPGGRIIVRAEIRSDGGAPRPGRWIAIHVIDNGPGIPKDQQERIFEEFSRLGPEAKGGAGLGLAISRSIARALGGDVTVESEPGRGSTFTIWLPISDRPEPERHDDGSKSASESGSMSVPRSGSTFESVPPTR